MLNSEILVVRKLFSKIPERNALLRYVESSCMAFDALPLQ